jgi:multidrug transporter EmrE-like cation transporter
VNLPTFLFILTGVLLNAGAQLLLKAGVHPLGPLTVTVSTLLPTFVAVAKQWKILAGLMCYVVSVCVWIIGLSRVEVSIAYPMLSLGYVVNAVAAAALFGEALGPARSVGMLLILAGVFIISRT